MRMKPYLRMRAGSGDGESALQAFSARHKPCLASPCRRLTSPASTCFLTSPATFRHTQPCVSQPLHMAELHTSCGRLLACTDLLPCSHLSTIMNCHGMECRFWTRLHMMCWHCMAKNSNFCFERQDRLHVSSVLCCSL